MDEQLSYVPLYINVLGLIRDGSYPLPQEPDGPGRDDRCPLTGVPRAAPGAPPEIARGGGS